MYKLVCPSLKVAKKYAAVAGETDWVHFEDGFDWELPCSLSESLEVGVSYRVEITREGE